MLAASSALVSAECGLFGRVPRAVDLGWAPPRASRTRPEVVREHTWSRTARTVLLCLSLERSLRMCHHLRRQLEGRRSWERACDRQSVRGLEQLREKVSRQVPWVRCCDQHSFIIGSNSLRVCLSANASCGSCQAARLRFQMYLVPCAGQCY